MCLIGGKVDWMISQANTRKMSHHLLDHRNQQPNNEKSIYPILTTLEANGATGHWRRPWMQLGKGQLH